MEKQENAILPGNHKAQGVWERRTGDRRWGQNQLFGSFRINSGVTKVSQSHPTGDPTENVLAAIASILDNPKAKPPPPPPAVDPSPISKTEEIPGTEPVFNTEVSQAEEVSQIEQVPHTEEVPVTPAPPAAVPSDADVEGYVKLGPGPLDAIRFKWTARPAGDGTYFVDETVGNNSRVITSGPMPKQDAIKLIDERERGASARFEAIKNEMTGRRAATT